MDSSRGTRVSRWRTRFWLRAKRSSGRQLGAAGHVAEFGELAVVAHGEDDVLGVCPLASGAISNTW